jgi:hypothetical protein
MFDLDDIKKYAVERPDRWTMFGYPDDYDKLPQTHRDQIIFLNKEANTYLYGFLNGAKLYDTNDNPFRKNNFKHISEYTIKQDGEKELKKWLYNREIPFKTPVFLHEDSFIYITWKMVVKYSPDIFHGDDVIVFDKTLNWCLFYFHHDHLFFGKDNIYDPKEDEEHMAVISELKKQYPHFKFPY